MAKRNKMTKREVALQYVGRRQLMSVKHLRGSKKPESRFTKCGRFTGLDAMVDNYDHVPLADRCCECAPVESREMISAARDERMRNSPEYKRTLAVLRRFAERHRSE